MVDSDEEEEEEVREEEVGEEDESLDLSEEEEDAEEEGGGMSGGGGGGSGGGGGGSGPSGGPHLVVVPASVLANWKREAHKVCPGLRVATYHGPAKDRSRLQRHLRSQPRPFDILLTTYTLFERDSSSSDRAFLLLFRFQYIILDEAHSIKNVNTSRFRRLLRLKADQRLLLSGTPVQNNLGELLALLQFVMPRLFNGTEDVGELFSEADDSTIADVRRMMRPLVLRRVKRSVQKQLVPKEEQLVVLPMEPQQQQLYDSIARSAVARMQQRGKKQQQRKKQKREEESMSIATTGSGREAKSIFTDLRKASNHPLLLRVQYSDEPQLRRIARLLNREGAFGDTATDDMVYTELCGSSDAEISGLCASSASNELGELELQHELLFSSAKCAFLRDRLPGMLSEGHRVLIFSQWTSVLDMLEMVLSSLQLQFLRLDGSTPVGERQPLVDKFNSAAETAAPGEEGGGSSPNDRLAVMLLSTRAGGLGLNLTSADTVIFHDLDFNPQNDRQAEDRAHRIGQTRTVRVLKLLCAGTVDEQMHAIGQRKRSLGEALEVANGSGSSSSSSSSRSNGRGGKGNGSGASGGGGGGRRGASEDASIANLLAQALVAFEEKV